MMDVEEHQNISIARIISSANLIRWITSCNRSIVLGFARLLFHFVHTVSCPGQTWSLTRFVQVKSCCVWCETMNKSFQCMCTRALDELIIVAIPRKFWIIQKWYKICFFWQFLFFCKKLVNTNENLMSFLESPVFFWPPFKIWCLGKIWFIQKWGLFEPDWRVFTLRTNDRLIFMKKLHV